MSEGAWRRQNLADKPCASSDGLQVSFALVALFFCCQCACCLKDAPAGNDDEHVLAGYQNPSEDSTHSFTTDPDC